MGADPNPEKSLELSDVQTTPRGVGERAIESQAMRKLLVALLLILVALAIAAFVFLKKKNAVFDTQEVERIAARLLPGARPASGLKGVLAFKLDDLEVAILAPGLPQARAENLQAGQLRIIIASPQSEKPPPPSEILAKISQVQQDKAEAMEMVSKNPVALQIGGKPYPAQESKLKVREGGQLLREDFTILLVDKHPVIVLLTGNEENYPEKARAEFLAGLNAPTGPPHPDLPAGLANKLPPGPRPRPAFHPPVPAGKPPGPPAIKPPGPPAAMARPSIPKPSLSRPAMPRPTMPRPAIRKPHLPRPEMPGDLPEPGGPPGPPGF